MTSAMTSSLAAARARKLAGGQWRDDANGGHQHVEGDVANSPVTKTAAEDQRTATTEGWTRSATYGDAPATYGDDLVTTTVTSPSSNDDRSDGGARLHGARALQTAAGKGEGGGG
uniref:Retrotransposon protein, putative, Ty3-gypsy subclass n=1 Tax=Oryza sativa subsp. japonica TaxID=39947 RepID=Q2QRY2_ORYSJ|nr:retrotransposon protein, putative, Ty3-gypsy subclass [Oryza sativa Japonica Group]